MNQEHPSSNRSELKNSSGVEQSQENQDTTKPSETNQLSETDQTSKEGTGILSTLQTILGAMFGVQSEQQRQKDFEKGSPIQFIVGGIIFVVVFILTILYFVNSALENAGAS